MKLLKILCLFLLCGCQRQEKRSIEDLTKLKKEFLEQISSCCIDEGPFCFNYSFRTILLSKQIVSLFGELNVRDRMPHGWNYYEGKTFYVENNQHKEISLDDLFKTNAQKECLRQICERAMKEELSSYFSGKEPLRTTLEQKDIHTFVIDDKHVIIIFQPYVVGGSGDGPFIVKIPFSQLKGKWQSENPIEKLLPITKNFISCWDQENWICDVQPDHSIGYRD